MPAARPKLQRRGGVRIPMHGHCLAATPCTMQVAASIGADCVMITGGHHSRSRLETDGVPVIDCFEELLSLIGMAESEEKQ